MDIPSKQIGTLLSNDITQMFMALRLCAPICRIIWYQWIEFLEINKTSNLDMFNKVVENSVNFMLVVILFYKAFIWVLRFEEQTHNIVISQR